MVCTCVCVCVLVWASLLHACHSSVSVPPCLTGSFCCVCGEPRAHSGISAPQRNPLESLLVTSDTQAIHIPCTEPQAVSSTEESYETELHPGLVSHPASPLNPGSQSLTVSVCISAKPISTKKVTDLFLSLIPHHIYA